MPSRDALHEVQFFNPDEFLDELRTDAAEAQVERNIVRLSHSRHPTWKRVNFHRDHHIEASYVNSESNQLVKLRAYCGWTRTAQGEVNGRIEPDVDDEHNREVLARADEIGTKLKRALQELKLKLRTGGLFIEGDAEPASWEYERAPIADVEFCASCEEPIYFSNEQWRHTSDKRADRVITEVCGDCQGTGLVKVGRHNAACSCIGGTRKRFEHSAAPREKAVAV